MVVEIETRRFFETFEPLFVPQYSDTDEFPTDDERLIDDEGHEDQNVM